MKWPKWLMRERIMIRKGLLSWILEWAVVIAVAWIFFKFPLAIFCHKLLGIGLIPALAIASVVGSVAIIIFKRYQQKINLLCSCFVFQFLFRVFG